MKGLHSVEMEELIPLLKLAMSGDTNAYDRVVFRFRDMAFGYAYSIIRDFDLAEDATQEAFVQAFRDLPMLREPPAFPGWLRRIVFKHCDRLIRHKRVPTVPLDEATEVATDALDPAQIVEAREGQAVVLSAIDALPDREREVTLLYYLGEYSQQEIADFLQVPLTTVNNRLHGARKRLKGRMMDMVKKTLKAYRLPEDFRVVVGPASRIHSASPSLVWFRDRWVLAWQDGEAWEPYDGPFWFLLSESADAREWSEPRRLEIDPQWQHAPRLCVAGDELLLLAHHHHQGVRIARTKDLQQWSNGPVLPLGDIGRAGILAHGGTVNIVYPRWCSAHQAGDSVDVISSADGVSWRWLASPRPPRGTGITDAAGLVADGRLYALWREHEYTAESCHDVYVCWSDDDGATWSEPVKVETLSTPKGSLTLTAAMSPDGRLVIAQDARDEEGKSEIQAAISPDRGRTWPAKGTYTAGSLVDPALAFAPDGALILAGSSRRESKTQPWVVHSRLQRI